MIDPFDFQGQINAFKVGALIAAPLLHHEFVDERFAYSRKIDPIVGVSFTGLFDFFVKAFGVEWLQWWEAGRPKYWGGTDSIELKIRQYPMAWQVDFDQYTADSSDDAPGEVQLSEFFSFIEAWYLTSWQSVVKAQLRVYCKRNNLRVPNRCTTVQPAGTKSLLTGASPGWHPPKAQRYIRRITFAKDDPVALAMMDLGYSIVPAQSDKDENGNLLNDPFDVRCTEWLVEMPVEVPWANIPGADQIEIEKFSATAQFDFYMQVQRYYVGHNTSATIELREEEIEPLAQAIHQAIQNNDGYISAALLARYDAPYPRLPFEKIDKDTYDRLSEEVRQRRKTDDFYAALTLRDRGESPELEQGPMACDSDKCLMPGMK